ncbi:MAG: glycosyltransferase family 25 protein [Patescibacteria group bacterium]
MKIFVINLRRRMDRRISMETQLNREKLPFEIIPALELKDIQKSDVSGVFNKGTMYQPNEIACSASHRLIYARMIKDNIPKAMIFEDDVVMPVDFSNIVEALDNHTYDDIDWLQVDYPSVGFGFIRQWTKVYVGFFEFKITYMLKFFVKFPIVVAVSLYEQFLLWFVGQTFQSRIPTVVRFYRDVYFASCYIVTLSAAKKLLAAQTPLMYTADKLPNMLKKEGFKMRICIPRFTYQDNQSFGSDLTPVIPRK